MRRVDAHHHIWELGPGSDWIDPVEMAALRRDFTLAELWEQAEPVGVERSVVVQTRPYLGETRDLLSLAERSDLLAAVVGWVDLTAPDVPERLSELRAGSGGKWLAGIRHQTQGEPDPWWHGRPDVRRGLRAVGTAGLVYELLVFPHQLAAAIDTVRALPEVTFVLDHIAKPPIASGELEPWASAIRTLAREPNVACKLSGMVTEADWSRWTVDSIRRYADVVLDCFGPSRLMFGSDWPVCLLAAEYTRVVELADSLTEGLDDDAREQIFAATAERVYQLG